MIIKNVNVKINNNSTSLAQQSIILYKGDSGLLLTIKLEGFKFKLSSIGKVDASIVNMSNAKLTTITDLTLKDGNILLPLNEEGLLLNEEGTHKVQLHIYDPELNRISTPTFDIICKNPIYL